MRDTQTMDCKNCEKYVLPVTLWGGCQFCGSYGGDCKDYVVSFVMRHSLVWQMGTDVSGEPATAKLKQKVFFILSRRRLQFHQKSWNLFTKLYCIKCHKTIWPNFLGGSLYMHCIHTQEATRDGERGLLTSDSVRCFCAGDTRITQLTRKRRGK
jgi:hypothetical protein